GPSANLRVSRITTASPTLGNAAGKMLAGLAGRPLQANEEVDPDAFVGQDYEVLVEEVTGGGSRVVDVRPLGAPAALTPRRPPCGARPRPLDSPWNARGRLFRPAPGHLFEKDFCYEWFRQSEVNRSGRRAQAQPGGRSGVCRPRLARPAAAHARRRGV